MNYTSALKLFKKSLLGGSEHEIVFKEIIDNISTNRIRWLDIGLGNGKYTKKIVDQLTKRGFQIELTGIDLSRSSLKEAKLRFPNSNIKLGNMDSFNFKEKYDIIHVCQSLYYVKRKDKFLKKVCSCLAEGGLLIVTLWSRRDSLYKLHERVYFGKDLATTIEETAGDIKRYTSCFVDIHTKYFYGLVDYALWKKSLKNLKKMLFIISRISANKNLAEKNILFTKKMVDKLHRFGKRINGTIIAKKKYEITHFNRKYLNQILKKRYPSYVYLVKKMRGDNESLFMGSWEKETEYISYQFKPGRILEVCCAAGCKSIILGKRHEVVAIDINPKRIIAARSNACLFNCEKNVRFIVGNGIDAKLLSKLGKFSAILVDADWRERLSDPIKKQNMDPLKTTPRTDKLYPILKKYFPDTPIIFKVSPFVRVSEMASLDPCRIEEVYIDNKFMYYNVYYSPEIKKVVWEAVNLKNEN